MSNAVTSDQYLDEYGTGLVGRWDDLVGWEARSKSEGTFFLDLLREHGARRILDAATGTGFHAAAFADAGYDVTAVDGAPEMVARARANLAERGYPDVACEVADWRDLAATAPGPFDAVVCLGNSFGHLFSEADLVASLRSFYEVLSPGGLFVLDSRNYDRVLDGTASSFKRNYCCVGNDADVSLDVSGPDRVAITYKIGCSDVYRIETHAWRRAELSAAIGGAGFTGLEVRGDFKTDFDPANVEFFVYTARKPA